LRIRLGSDTVEDESEQKIKEANDLEKDFMF